MPIPSTKGQYRRVRYDDDGVSIYQCLWCLQTIRIADDPQYGWNFCPCCGKSWFNKLECRDAEVPRWFYDRYGNHGPLDVAMYPPRPESTAVWIIECRSNCFSETWSEWHTEWDGEKKPHTFDYRFILSMLNQFRLRHDMRDREQFQYRVRLSRKNNLTFHVPGVDFSVMTQGQKNLRNLYLKYGTKL